MIPPETIRKARSTDLVQLAESRGISLKPKGKDLAGLCPFHEDTEPSLIITPGKNLFHCFSCGAGGDPIEFIMKLDSLEFADAVRQLSGENKIQELNPELDIPGERSIIESVLNHYERSLMNSKEALAYLKSRGLTDISQFRVGFSDGSLTNILPSGSGKEAHRVRQLLRAKGIIRSTTGREHFHGCLVFPIFDEHGNLTEMYGRRIHRGRSSHLYLPGPHAGIWNREAMNSNSIIICESIIDALSFHAAGMKNTTASYGVEGFTKEMLAAVETNQPRRIYIAYDNDAAGNRAAKSLEKKIKSAVAGIEVLRINFPAGLDANDCLVRQGPEMLRELVQIAGRIHDEEAPVQITEHTPKDVTSLPSAAEVQRDGQEVRFQYGERKYRVRGLFRNSGDHIMKINLKLQRGDVYFLDTFDLLAAKQRQAFIDAAAEETSAAPDIIKYDLGKILSKLEDFLEERQKENVKKEIEVEVPEERRLKAIEYLKDPELVQNIVLDFEKMGLVGERINSLIGYLGALSRKTDSPLAIIIQSSSSAGKSALMEAVLAMVPEEDRVKYSFMTGQSLYYMQSRSLKHKIIAISEEEGVEKAMYAIKILQSEKKVSIATTSKDPDTGLPDTKEFTVEGPVMIIITTTSVEIDEELQNRGLILTINEDREQTRLIQQLQREKRSLEGILRKRRQETLEELHQDVQRMIRPLSVAIPFRDLDFPDTRLRLRRDHEKFLTLIETIALLQQYQRPVHARQDGAGTLEYIEATESDMALAVFLAAHVFGISLDDLAPQTRKLLERLDRLVNTECEKRKIEKRQFRFTRRLVREITGWNDTRLRRHLDRLVDLEYLVVHGGGQGKLIEYELIFSGDSKGPIIPGLDKYKLESRLAKFLSASFAPLKGNFAHQNGNFVPTSHPVRTPLVSTSPFASKAKSMRESANGSERDDFQAKSLKTHIRG